MWKIPAFRQTGWLTRTTARDDEVWVSLSFLLALIGMETDKKPWFEFGSWYIRPADLSYMPAMPTMRKSWSPLWISMVDIKHLRFAVPARCCQFTQEPDTVPPQQSWRMAWSQEWWDAKVVGGFYGFDQPVWTSKKLSLGCFMMFLIYYIPGLVN